MIRGTHSLKSLFNASGRVADSGTSVGVNITKPIVVDVPVETVSSKRTGSQPKPVIDQNIQPIPRPEAIEPGTQITENASNVGTGGGGNGYAEDPSATSARSTPEKKSIFNTKNIIIALVVIISVIMAIKYFKK